MNKPNYETNGQVQLRKLSCKEKAWRNQQEINVLFRQENIVFYQLTYYQGKTMYWVGHGQGRCEGNDSTVTRNGSTDFLSANLNPAHEGCSSIQPRKITDTKDST